MAHLSFQSFYRFFILGNSKRPYSGVKMSRPSSVDMLTPPNRKFFVSPLEKERRGGRVVEGARLESVLWVKPYEGSNPSLSSTFF